MSKIVWSKIGRRMIAFLLASFIVYAAISLVLIYWPLPPKESVANYDYSSIEKIKGNLLGEKQWIRTRDNGELFSRLYKSESKDVLILIHGSGAESRYLSVLADSIAKAKIATVLTPDLRGHGENKGKKGDIAYIGQLESDIEDLIAFSKQKLGAERIILMGHSSGGGLVLRFIGNPRNTKVYRAIMLAPYLGYDAITVKPNSGGWVTVALKRIIGLSMMNNIGITAFNGLPVLFFNRPGFIDDTLQTPSYSFRMIVNFAPKNYKEEIKSINVPCLVLVGRQDESFYPEQFQMAFAPAKQFVKTEIVDGVKHLNIVSNQQVFKKIKEWMKD